MEEFHLLISCFWAYDDLKAVMKKSKINITAIIFPISIKLIAGFLCVLSQTVVIISQSSLASNSDHNSCTFMLHSIESQQDEILHEVRRQCDDLIYLLLQGCKWVLMFQNIVAQDHLLLLMYSFHLFIIYVSYLSLLFSHFIPLCICSTVLEKVRSKGFSSFCNCIISREGLMMMTTSRTNKPRKFMLLLVQTTLLYCKIHRKSHTCTKSYFKQFDHSFHKVLQWSFKLKEKPDSESKTTFLPSDSSLLSRCRPVKALYSNPRRD